MHMLEVAHRKHHGNSGSGVAREDSGSSVSECVRTCSQSRTGNTMEPIAVESVCSRIQRASDELDSIIKRFNVEKCDACGYYILHTLSDTV